MYEEVIIVDMSTAGFTGCP